MEETRKIGDYSVKYSMYIGHKDIALGENPSADKDERYMCCFVETNAIFRDCKGFRAARSGRRREDYPGERKSLHGSRYE